MATHPGMLIAYDDQGDVVATLDYLVQYDEDGTPLGLVDFAAHEEAGLEHTAIWRVGNAVGSKFWPEWLGARAHEFRVVKEGEPGRKRLVALVHRKSGYRRERAAVESAIAARAAERQPADIRDLVGGPDRPLKLDADGRTVPRERRVPLPTMRVKALRSEQVRSDHERNEIENLR